MYSGTSLSRTPLGPHTASLIKRCPYFGVVCTLLYVGGTVDSVLKKKRSVLILEVLSREVPLYTSHVHIPT